MRIVPCVFEFHIQGVFRVGNLEKKIASREHRNCFIVNSKEKGKTSKISLCKDFIDMKARNILPPLLCHFHFHFCPLLPRDNLTGLPYRIENHFQFFCF